MTAVVGLRKVTDIAVVEFDGGAACVSRTNDRVVLQPADVGAPDALVLSGRLSFVPPDSYCPPDLARAVKVRSRFATRAMPGTEEPLDRPALPEVPRLDLSLVFEMSSSPMGVLRQRFELRSGRVDSVSLPEPGPAVETDVPLVVVRLDWADHLAVRSGDGCVLEAIEAFGNVEGDWQALLAAHGVLQHPAWAAWWSEPVPGWLIAFGHLTRTGEWAALLGG